MDGIDVRIVDLMDVFTMQAYVHAGFKGRRRSSMCCR